MKTGWRPPTMGLTQPSKSRSLGQGRKRCVKLCQIPLLVWLGTNALLFVGCRQDMHDQPKYEALEGSSLFSDGRASRMPISGTVARDHLKADSLFYRGTENGQFAARFPAPVTMDVLKRGQDRYQIYCTPCHDQTGSGRGMVVLRGFPAPPSYHEERLRSAPVGYFFDVITRGYGKMYSFGETIPPEDRWAIVSYIRALQRSQHATLSDVPNDRRGTLDANDQ